MTERLRLRDIDADALSAGTAKLLLQHASTQLAAATSGGVSWALHALVRYARGESIEGTLETLLEDIAPLYRSVLHPDAHPTHVVAMRPETELEFVVAAALARQQIDAGREIGCTELSLLTGLNRDHLTEIAGAGAIPSAYRVGKDRRKPWRFKPTKALKAWIADKAL